MTHEERVAKLAAAMAEKERKKLQDKAQKAFERQEKVRIKEEEKARIKAEKQAAREGQIVDMNNNVRRPRADSVCGKLWAIFDAISAEQGSPAANGQVLARGRAEGFNDHTIRTQYASWRRFYGISGKVVNPNTVAENEADAAAKAAAKQADKQAKAEAKEAVKAAKAEAKRQVAEQAAIAKAGEKQAKLEAKEAVKAAKAEAKAYAARVLAEAAAKSAPQEAATEPAVTE